MEIVSRSPTQTQKIAQKLAQDLAGGDVVALYGPLGAGKTVFVKGIAKSLGIKKRILSPTFIFVRSYPLTINRLPAKALATAGQPLTFYHIDLYRAEDVRDFAALGLPEIFSPDAIAVIEWADRAGQNLPKIRWEVKIEKLSENKRRITIKPPIYSSGDRAKRGSREVSAKKAAQILKNGGVVIFPTDTVYGIGCRFDDQKATGRIYQIKGTPQNQPFPILVSDIKQVVRLAKISTTAQKLIRKFWPGGLTIILPTRHSGAKSSQTRRSDRISKIGFRMPDSALIRNLIEKVGASIIGTSANFHGAKSPKSFEELDPKFIKLADFVLKGECKLGVESTVVDATVDPPKVTRIGAIKI